MADREVAIQKDRIAKALSLAKDQQGSKIISMAATMTGYKPAVDDVAARTEPKSYTIPPRSKLEQQYLLAAQQYKKENLCQPQKCWGKVFQGEAFVAKPTTIEFLDFEVGKTYTTTITLTNVSFTFNTFKLQALTPAITDFFDIAYTFPGAMSAGTSCKLTITFSPKLNEDITDKLPILAQTGPQAIPIICRTKKVAVSFEPLDRVISFGEVLEAESATRKIVITNAGALPTSFDIVGDVLDRLWTGPLPKPPVFKSSEDYLEHVAASTESPPTDAQEEEGGGGATPVPEIHAGPSTSIVIPSDGGTGEATVPAIARPVSAGSSATAATAPPPLAPVATPHRASFPYHLYVTLHVSKPKMLIEETAYSKKQPEDDDDDEEGVVMDLKQPFTALPLPGRSQVTIRVGFCPMRALTLDARLGIRFSDGFTSERVYFIEGQGMDVPVFMADPNRIITDLYCCYFDTLYRDKLVLRAKDRPTSIRCTPTIPRELKPYMNFIPKIGYLQPGKDLEFLLEFRPTSKILEEAATFITHPPTPQLDIPIVIDVAGQVMPVTMFFKTFVCDSLFAFEPSSLDFGRCTVKEGISRTVVITNNALLAQTIGFINLPKEFSVLAPEGGACSLLPGESRTFEIAFHPSTVGPIQTKLSLKTDRNEDYVFGVTGIGYDLPLKFSEGHLKMKRTAFGEITTAATMLTNTSSTVRHTYQFAIPSDTGLVIHPVSGEIEPSSTIPISVSFQASTDLLVPPALAAGSPKKSSGAATPNPTVSVSTPNATTPAAKPPSSAGKKKNKADEEREREEREKEAARLAQLEIEREQRFREALEAADRAWHRSTEAEPWSRHRTILVPCHIFAPRVASVRRSPTKSKRGAGASGVDTSTTSVGAASESASTGGGDGANSVTSGSTVNREEGHVPVGTIYLRVDVIMTLPTFVAELQQETVSVAKPAAAPEPTPKPGAKKAAPVDDKKAAASKKALKPGELTAVPSAALSQVPSKVVRPSLHPHHDYSDPSNWLQKVVEPLATLNFGYTPAHKPTSKTLLIRHIAHPHPPCGSMAAQKLTIEPLDPFGPFTVIKPPTESIAAGQLCEITVQFCPKSEATFVQDLVFISAEQERLAIRLVGRGLAPSLQIQIDQPNVLNTDEVLYFNMDACLAGESTTTTMKFTNPCGFDLPYTIQLLEGTVHPMNFNYSTPFIIQPASGVIPPNGTTVITMTFAPDHEFAWYSADAEICYGGKNDKKLLRFVGVGWTHSMFAVCPTSSSAFSAALKNTRAMLSASLSPSAKKPLPWSPSDPRVDTFVEQLDQMCLGKPIEAPLSGEGLGFFRAKTQRNIGSGPADPFLALPRTLTLASTSKEPNLNNRFILDFDCERVGETVTHTIVIGNNGLVTSVEAGGGAGGGGKGGKGGAGGGQNGLPGEYAVEGLTEMDSKYGWSVAPVRENVEVGGRKRVTITFAPTNFLLTLVPLNSVPVTHQAIVQICLKGGLVTPASIAEKLLAGGPNATTANPAAAAPAGRPAAGGGGGAAPAAANPNDGAIIYTFVCKGIVRNSPL